jgi:carbamate kinase
MKIVLGAQTQGMIGYWLVQAMTNALPGREVACLVRRDGSRWRRVVPSPEPAGLLDLSAVRMLLDRQVIVICAGGVPVAREVAGRCAGWRRWWTRT